jgi:hypothetical protein
MSRSLRFVPPLCAVLGLLCGSLLLAAPPPSGAKLQVKKPTPVRFVRLQQDARKQPTALETATIRYAAEEGGVTVDLVGVVHIGDRAYYEKLNKQLADYDVVLYELVAPKGTRIPKGGKRDTENPLALVQQAMKTVLDLESQTEQIDYTKKHFMHADLSPEEMTKAMKKRGDDTLTVLLSVAADLIRQQNLREQKQQTKAAPAEEETDIFSLLLDPEGPAKLKRMLAEQLADPDSPASELGATLNTILVADRNEAALKVLQKELTKGKKKIAIFYGAAHMTDFDKRLREDFGLKRGEPRWLQAWDLKKKSRGLGDLFKLFDDE